MNQSKLIRKFIIGTVLGFALFGFIPALQGVQTERIRPIEDWIYGNDPTIWDPTDAWGAHTWRTWDDWIRADTMTGNPFGAWGGFGDGDTNLIITLDWVALNDEIEYSGFVLEREMPDGSFRISVNLHVENMYIEVYRFAENWNWPRILYIEELVLVGTMDYQFHFEFILEKEIPGGNCRGVDLYIPPGVRESGAELPPFWLIYYLVNQPVIGARWEKFEFNGKGTGDLVRPGWLPPLSPIVEDQPEFWWYVPPPNTPDNPPELTGEKANVKVNFKEMIVPSPHFDWGWLYFPNSGFEMVQIF